MSTRVSTYACNFTANAFIALNLTAHTKTFVVAKSATNLYMPILPWLDMSRK
jgi:hypothetical protein